MYTLLFSVFPLCNEVCYTPTWSNQTHQRECESICVSSSAESCVHPHWSLAAAGWLKLWKIVSLYRQENVAVTNLMKWRNLRPKWGEVQVLRCVRQCSLINILVAVERALQHSCSLFWWGCSSFLFNSEGNIEEECMGKCCITVILCFMIQRGILMLSH